MWKLSLLVLSMVVSVYAKPHRKEQPMPCVELSITAGEQLEYEVETTWKPAESFKTNVNTMAGVDMFDDSERTEAICNFEGVTSLSEVKAIFEETGSALFKYGYALVVNHLELFRERATWNIDYFSNQFQYNYGYSYNENDVDNQQRYVDLIRMIEASGITRLYTELRPVMNDILQGDYDYASPYSVEDYIPTPLSNAPVQTQCHNLALEIRNMLDVKNELYSDEYWNHEDTTVHSVNTWLGMEDLTLGTLRRYICAVLEGAAANGLDGVYSALDELGVIDHLLKSGYRSLQYHAEREEMFLADVLNPDENAYYSYYYRPSEEKMAHYEDRQRFWDAVRNMNLMNLQLDL